MVMHCPSTPSTISERAISLGCNQTYQYHCLRNKEDEMVEKCLEFSWIQKEKCAVYDADAQKIDEWKCLQNLGICPKKQYLSNDVMSYSACVPSLLPTNPAEGKDDTNTFLSKYWIWLAIVVATLIVAAVIFMVYRRRTRSSHDFNESHDEEKIPLSIAESNKNPGGAKEQTKKDSDTYFKTETYKYIEDHIFRSAVSVLVVGEPGSGKSVLGKMIQDRFKWQKTCTVICLKRLEDICYDTNEDCTKTVYILDDCLEVLNQYPDLTTTYLDQILNIHKTIVKQRGNCLVITVSKHTFENNLHSLQKLKLTEMENIVIVDLSTEDFKLTKEDKEQILKYHTDRINETELTTDETNVCKVADEARDFGFPLLCYLYYKNDCFKEEGETFFRKTRDIIKKFAERLSTGSPEQKCQYCTLIYCALCGGQIQCPKIEVDALLAKIAEVSDMGALDLKFNFDCCLISKGKDNSYEIIHEEISKLLFFVFGQRHTSMVIEMCEEETLLKYVRTNVEEKKKDCFRKCGLLIITKTFYNCLAERLYKLNANEKHVVFQDPEFLKFFEEVKNQVQESVENPTIEHYSDF